MTVCLARDGNTRFCESRNVHVAGPTLAGEILCSSCDSAEINQPIRRLLSRSQGRGEHARGSEAKMKAERLQDCHIQLAEAQPGAFEERQEKRAEWFPVRRLSVVEAQGLAMLPLPIAVRIDLHPVDALGEAIDDWYRQPLPALFDANAVSVLPFVFLELDRVKQDENISGVQLVEVSKPGKVLRLVDGDFHGGVIGELVE